MERKAEVSAKDVWDIGTAVIFSLGGAGALILASSAWLGKIWAERLMTNERAQHEHALAELRADLERTNQETLGKLRVELETEQRKHLSQHDYKFDMYKYVVSVVGDFLADVDLIRIDQRPAPDAFDRFNRARLKVDGHLALVAPQSVMDAYDRLIEKMLPLLNSDAKVTSQQWKEIRALAYGFINAVRQDIGIDTSKVEYRGRF